MLAIADLVHQVAASVGTGDFTVRSVFGKQTFSSAFGTGSGNTFPYFISSRAADEWEAGVGYMSDVSTLVRQTVLKSSNSNALANFSLGTKDITTDVPAEYQVYNSNSPTVADGGFVMWDGTDGRKIKTSGLILDTDTAFTANSDSRIPTQKAVKAYADQLSAAVGAMVFKAVIDCSANPNYPAADAGWTYRVSVAGKIGGASGINVEVGDLLLCIQDGTASGNQATVGSKWNITQTNIDGAVIGPASSTSGNAASFSGTSGKLIQDSGKALPSGALVGTSDTQTLTNKTIAFGNNTCTGFPSGGPIFDVTTYGADPTGTSDSKTAIQNAIHAANAVSSGNQKSMVYLPCKGTGSTYKISNSLLWEENVNIYCEPGVQIIATSTMDVMLYTGVGGDSLDGVWLIGGFWNGDYKASHGVWIKEGRRVRVKDIVIRAIGPYVNGTSEPITAYFRVGDATQSDTCYEIFLEDFSFYRWNGTASPTQAPAQNYGVYSGDGASDSVIHNGVINGVRSAVIGQMAAWVIDKVKHWNDDTNDGPNETVFWAQTYGATRFINCEAGVNTTNPAFRFNCNSGEAPSTMINNFIDRYAGTDNSGAAVLIDSNALVYASGNIINCNPSHRYNTCFSVIGSGILRDNIFNNVVSPNGFGPLSIDGAIGYGSGAGGTVTQSTNKSTAVTLNQPSGVITTSNASLANSTAVSFTLNNSEIGPNDIVLIWQVGGGTFGNYDIGQGGFPASGSVKIQIFNSSGGSLSQALQIAFAVIKVSTS